jgi:hypothetical protein
MKLANLNFGILIFRSRNGRGLNRNCARAHAAQRSNYIGTSHPVGAADTRPRTNETVTGRIIVQPLLCVCHNSIFARLLRKRRGLSIGSSHPEIRSYGCKIRSEVPSRPSFARMLEAPRRTREPHGYALLVSNSAATCQQMLFVAVHESGIDTARTAWSARPTSAVWDQTGSGIFSLSFSAHDPT